MNRDQIPVSGQDDLDLLFRSAVNDALDSLSQLDLVGPVLEEIRRRERRRLLVLLTAGLLATAFCVLSGLPVLGWLLESLTADLGSVLGKVEPVDWSPGLSTAVLVGAAIAGGWLFLLGDELA